MSIFVKPASGPELPEYFKNFHTVLYKLLFFVIISPLFGAVQALAGSPFLYHAPEFVV
jgi:hypothetical protein